MKKYENVKLFDSDNIPNDILDLLRKFRTNSILNVYFRWCTGYNQTFEKKTISKWFIDNGAIHDEYVLIYYNDGSN